MRISLVISSLRPGGAERVAANLANEWTRAGHRVSLITLATADLDFYPLDQRIDRRALHLREPSTGFFDGIATTLHRLRWLRQELRATGSDVTVSFIDRTNVLVLMAAAGLGTPVVVSERTDPRMHPIGTAWEALRWLTYRRASALVVQTESVVQWARGLVASRQVAVIPNPISEACMTIGRASARSRQRRVVALGRLVPSKGLDTLIAAFDRASARHRDWSLVIAGEGPLGDALRRQASSTRCADRIAFAGLVRNPEQLLGDSEILVLSSRFEGFPNALVEGMACGCSVISTDCPSGPAEIITNGVDGVLVPVDCVDALAGSMEALMADGTERRRLGEAAVTSAGRFQADGIAERWVRLLRSVSAAHAGCPLPAEDLPRFASER
jgi:GalNAc-alpha-(1->4)-GalNAc-alpha-(1->3)-diNAcBac-PP-undecaprenol alpha-1,4-N-acetyl-D-galactosaminyltransferase